MQIIRYKTRKRQRKGVLHAIEGIIAGLIIISFTSGAFNEPMDINNWKVAKLHQESRELINTLDKANITNLVLQNRPDDIEGIIESILDDRLGFAITTIGIPQPILNIGLLIDTGRTEENNRDLYLKYKKNISNNIREENTVVNINGRETLIHINTTNTTESWDKYELLLIQIPMEYSNTNYYDTTVIQSDLDKVETLNSKLLDFLQDGKGIILVSNLVDKDCLDYEFLKNLFYMEWNKTLNTEYSGANAITNSDSITLNNINPQYHGYNFQKLFRAMPIHIDTSNYGYETITSTSPPPLAQKNLSDTIIKMGTADCVNPDCSNANIKYKNQQWITSKSGILGISWDTLIAKDKYNIIVTDETKRDAYESIYIDINQDDEFDSKFGALNCSGLDDQPKCDNHLGCKWNGGPCHEDPQGATPCIHLSEAQCNYQLGCSWDSITETCNGGPVTPCTGLTYTQCSYQKGCLWGGGSCNDLPEVTQCDGLSETVCGSKTDTGQRGCSWNTIRNICEDDFQTAGCDNPGNTEPICGNTMHTGLTGCAWDPEEKEEEPCKPAGERFKPGDIISLNGGDYMLTYIKHDGSYITLKTYENKRPMKIKAINTVSSVYTTHELEEYGPIGMYNYDSKTRNTRNNSQYVLMHTEKLVDTCGPGSDEKCPLYPAIIINYGTTNGRTAWISNNLNSADEWNLLKSLILFTPSNEHTFISKPFGKTNVISINKVEVINKDMFQPYIIQFKMWYYV